MTATQFKEFRLRESDETVNSYFESLMYKPMNIMIKGRFEFYKGENRMRFHAVKVLPGQTQVENKALVQRLDIYSDKKVQ